MSSTLRNLVRATFNGVTVVGTPGDLDFVKFDENSKIVGEWGIFEPAVSAYEEILFVTHDPLQEQDRAIWAERKEDLPAVYKVLSATDYFIIDVGVDMGVKLMEFAVSIPDVPREE